MGLCDARLSAAELEREVLEFAERAAKVPVELQQINKRSVHRAMEIIGTRAAIRAGTEIQALAFPTEASKEYMTRFRRDGASVSKLLDRTRCAVRRLSRARRWLSCPSRSTM